MASDGKRGYYALLPIGGFICYRKQTLMVRAIWGGGVVCKDAQGERVIIEGLTALNFIKRV